MVTLTRLRNHPVTLYIYICNQQKNLCDLHVHTMAEYSNQVHRKLSCIYVLKHLNSTQLHFDFELFQQTSLSAS